MATRPIPPGRLAVRPDPIDPQDGWAVFSNTPLSVGRALSHEDVFYYPCFDWEHAVDFAQGAARYCREELEAAALAAETCS